MERKQLLHSGGKFRSRQQVLERGSKDVFPQELLGQGGERKAVQRRCHLLWLLMDESCQEQAPGSAASAPRAAAAQENTSHRLQKEGKPASSQKFHLLGA